MERNFRIAVSNKGICILLVQIIFVCLYCVAVFRMTDFFRIATLAVIAILIYISFMSFLKSRYEIKDNEIIVNFYSEDKRNYRIDKITKIAYIDTSSKWRPFSKVPCHQLAIYFDRAYLKSIEPRTFYPADRDAFVETILRVNPNIPVEREEIKYKPFLVG